MPGLSCGCRSRESCRHQRRSRSSQRDPQGPRPRTPSANANRRIELVNRPSQGQLTVPLPPLVRGGQSDAQSNHSDPPSEGSRPSQRTEHSLASINSAHSLSSIASARSNEIKDLLHRAETLDLWIENVLRVKGARREEWTDQMRKDYDAYKAKNQLVGPANDDYDRHIQKHQGPLTAEIDVQRALLADKACKAAVDASELRLEFLEHWDDIFGTVKEWSTHVDQARGLLSSAQTSLENLRTAKRYATQEHLKIGLGFLEPEPKGQRNKVAKRKAKEERIKAAQAKKAGSGSKD